MASKKGSSKKTKAKSKHYPVVRRFPLSSTLENQTVRFFHVGRCLSAANRRLYRYGRVYPISIDMQPSAGQSVEVYALRDDWVTQKALQMAYRNYLKNTSAERESLGKQVARWEDFRVDPGVIGSEMVPGFHSTALARSVINDGEFELSNVIDANNVERTFTWGSPAATEYGILQEYDKAGNALPTPSVGVGDVPYADIDTDVDTVTAQNLEGDGNQPPYQRDGVYADTPFVRIAVLGVGANGDQKLSTGMFNAPCGLVILVGNSSNWNSDAMYCTVQAGDYKGVGGMSLLE